ncbi:hypothetical protein MUN81_10130 [Hymenobacter sp. 5317J-9]|uniref:hypothetical protein n=1 Tax=Hymenobacter sp. 5317J-9 TaxID=2932250 RepID=UPI001FD6D046|nr:hypothetical protein [Hymenobacter sp. 5317J-9]UOQ99835.1 hypothetical protein MUN81_10130 [Hymenobacter sp. 5317J-9]
MPALLAYLRLRSRLAWRLLVEVGWLRMAVLGPIILILCSRALLLAAPHPQAQWLVPVGLTLLLAPAHRQRADLRFLATSAPDFRRWLAVEYGICTLPAAGVLLGFGDWGAAALAMVMGAGVAWLPPAREGRSTRRRARSPFRSEAFEWVSGMRAGGLWAWPLLLAGAACQHPAPLGPVLALVLWLLVLLACYGTPEPLTMLTLAARTPRQFLRRRLMLGVGYAALTGAPFFGLLATSSAGVRGMLAAAVFWLGLVALLILTKYAFYPNATHIRTTQALVLGVALLLPGNPIYPVLLLVAVGGLIWQSRRRLETVLGQPQTNA